MKRNTCLITGASSGIGFELAKIFASKKNNLILVSRNRRRLNEIAKSLADLEKIKVNVIVEDLSKPNSAQKLYKKIKRAKLSVHTLVNNAGFGSYGEFEKLDLEKELSMIQLNITSLTELTHVCLPDIIKNKGRILNVASTAAFQPIPSMATYAATKAYVLSFSEALNIELKDKNVTVTTLCPGPTKTNFDKAAKMEKTGLFSGSNVMSAQEVAEIGYKALEKRKSVEVAGVQNKIGSVATKLVPMKTSAKIAAKIMKKK